MAVFESARSSIESMSWVKRIVLALTVLLIISVVVAFVLVPSSQEELVDSTRVAESSNFLALALLSFVAGALSFISPCTLPVSYTHLTLPTTPYV